MNGFDHWVLTGAMFLPLVGAILIAFIPRRNEAAIKAAALLTSLVTLAFGIYMVANFDYDHSRGPAVHGEPAVDRCHQQPLPRRASTGSRCPLLVLSMFITVLCIIYSWDHFPEPHDPKGFLILILILEVGMNGTFAAEDLILFFVFFELVLLPDVLHDRPLGWGPPRSTRRSSSSCSPCSAPR